MRELHTITRSAGVVGSATLLSRFLGLVRDIITASFFGTGLAMSAFVVAFQIPNLLRALLGEGALTAAFVPVFTEYMEKKGREESWRLARIVASLLLVILVGLVLVGFLLIRVLRHWLHLNEKFILVSEMFEVMLPYLVFICLLGLARGILNSVRHFAVPALSPVLLNLVWIASLFLLCPLFGASPEERIFGLAFGISLSGLVQFAFHLPVLKREGFHFRFQLAGHPAVKRIALLMGPGVLGLAVVQLNVLVDRFLALGWLGESAPATLYYGNRLVQFPLGVFVVSFATAALPMMSAQVAREKIEDFLSTLSYTLRMVFFVTVPATVGLIVLRRPIVALLFQRRAFGPESTEATAWVVLFYSVGLVAFSSVKIVTQAFYSLQDTKTPVRVAVASMLLNLGMNLLVVFNPWLKAHLREGGLALSTSIAAFANMAVLAVLLRRRLGPLRGREIGICTAKICAASAAMGLATWGGFAFFQGRFGGEGLPDRLAVVLLPMAVGVAVFLTAAALLRVRVIRELGAAFFRKAAPAGRSDGA